MSLGLSDRLRDAAKRAVVSVRSGRKRTKRRPYQYEPLTRSHDIRILILQPGVGDEPLQCYLQTSPLSEATFESISYVWGSTIRNHEIICGGHTIAITTNLWTALRHLRSDVPRILWADSICINQEDPAEKAHQVALMGRIFRLAEHVLIFIGADDLGHGELVVSLLDDMRNIIKSGLEQAGTIQDAFPFPDDNAPILKDPRWKSYNRLLEQSWFDRGWVVQEAAVARIGRLIWGRHELNWEDLMRTGIWLSQRAPALRKIVRSRIHVHKILHSHYHSNIVQAFNSNIRGHNLLQVLRWAKDLDFSDPRDRIFAFAELAQDFDRHVSVHPNYGISFLHVYQHFAMEYIHTTRDTELLDRVYHNEDSLHSEAPSWVPRWDIEGNPLAPSRGSHWCPLKSHKLSVQDPIIVDDSILRVQGVLMDKVVYTSDTYYVDTTTPRTILNLWKDVIFLEVDSPYPEANRIDAFLESLVGSEFEGEWVKWRQSRAALAIYLQTDWSEQDESARLSLGIGDGNSNGFVRAAKTMMQNRKFVLTRRGYMGLAPRIVRIGDTCAIIFGSTTSCILRKTSESLQYQLLGAASFMGKQPQEEDGDVWFVPLGDEISKDWVEWDVEEQDIDLC